MDDTQKILCLRFAYWFGAILDGIVFLMMIFPSLGSGIFSSDTMSYGMEYQYANAFGAPLMIGWTVLLLWADRKPLERRAVILITLFPVLAGLILANIILYINSIIPWMEFISRLFIQIVAVSIFSFAFIITKEIKID